MKEVMMNNKGRPKKEGLDRTIKFTVSDEIAETLDNTVKETGKSKSDLLRELLPIISSKDYEGLIPNTSMEILQSYSEKCWNVLMTPGCIFEVAALSNNMPAFVITEEPPVVYVKYPTFKIEVFCSTDPLKCTSQKDIEHLLRRKVTNKFWISAAQANCFIENDKMEKLQVPFVNEITCLEITLKDNLNCKNKIVEILKQNNYITTVCHSYCIRGIRVELLEGKKYFRVLQHE